MKYCLFAFLVLFVRVKWSVSFLLSHNCDVAKQNQQLRCSSSNINFRINKCFPFLSRREADRLILDERVTINGKTASAGCRVTLDDIVCLDGKRQLWENHAIAKSHKIDKDPNLRDFYYLKYWKPRGVTCTTDLGDPTNIIKAGNFHLFPQRLFTVGRLDKDSTGLILLTSDGRVNNALLNKSQRKEKVKIFCHSYLLTVIFLMFWIVDL